ncbi:helix-turn-helix transcriptional regulator [Phaeobacter sp.]|uniref:helix-turn-helix transcriptional regulator n=1 Tax=Phaeobacter sp. TaxID=1902409 RepID=UPI0025E0AFE7|nr:helix-turn-helix transcriptional regulator [Phaeobacter sp.]
MMLSHQSSEAYLAQVIAALGSPAFAQKLYDWLQQCFDIDNCTIIAFYQTGKPDVFFSHSSVRQVHERIESDYLAGVYRLDPFYDLHVKQAPDGLYRLRDCAPDHFHRHEYVAQYYGRTTLVDETCYHASPAAGVSVQICLGRDHSSLRSFSSKDLRSAEAISSIVCALVNFQWKSLSARDQPSDDSLLEHLKSILLTERGIRLSDRQCEVALLILRGHSTISIALVLDVSPQTVKVFRKQLYRKCGISSQAELFTLLTPFLAR